MAKTQPLFTGAEEALTLPVSSHSGSQTQAKVKVDEGLQPNILCTHGHSDATACDHFPTSMHAPGRPHILLGMKAASKEEDACLLMRH